MSERIIVWEDYASNYTVYLSNEDLDEQSDEEIGDQDFDTDGIGSPLRKMQSKTPQVFDVKNYVYSPWGAISRNDPFVPINFYPDMKVMHTKHFGAHTIEDFYDILDNIDGIAAWKALDPYCFIVAKAKIYEWREVMSSVNAAFGIKQSATKSVDDIINNLKSNPLYQYSTYVIDPSGIVSHCLNTDENYKEFVSFATTLVEDGASPGTVVIHEGKILCR